MFIYYSILRMFFEDNLDDRKIELQLLNICNIDFTQNLLLIIAYYLILRNKNTDYIVA